MNSKLLNKICLMLTLVLFGFSGCSEFDGKIPDAETIRKRKMISPSSEKYLPLPKEEVKFTFRSGHNEKVKSMDISADGKQLLTGDVSGRVVMWDLETGRAVMVIEEIEDAIYSASLSKKAEYAAVGTLHGGVYVYDTGTGKVIKRFEKGGNQVRFSRDGRLMALGGYGKPIRLISTDGFKEIRTFENSISHATCFDFSPDNTLLVSGDGNSKVKVWNVGSGSLVKELKGLNFWVHGVRFSPDGKKVAASSYILKLSKKYRTLVRKVTGKKGGSIEDVDDFTEDDDAPGPEDDIDQDTFENGGGIEEYSHITDVTVVLWDLESGKALSKYIHPKGALCLDYSPDGRFIATGGADNAFHIFDVNRKKVVFTEGLMNVRFINTVHFSPDGKKLYFAGGDGAVREFDLKSKKTVRTFDSVERGMRRARFSPEGGTFASGGDDGKIYVWDLEKMKLKESSKRLGGTVETLSYGSEYHLAASGSGGNVIILDLEKHRENVLPSPEVSKPVITMDWNHKKGMLVAGTAYGMALLWNVNSFVRNWEKRLFNDSILSVRLSDDGNRILTSGIERGNGVIRLIETGTGKVLKEHVVKEHPIWRAEFIPNTNRAAFCAGREVSLYDLKEGKTIKTFKGHKGPVWALSVSRNGRYIVSGGFRGEMVLWSVENGEEAGRVQAHSGEIMNLDFGDKGLILSAGRDRRMKFWNVENVNSPLCTLIVLKDDNWILYNEDGYFRASEDALKYIYKVRVKGFQYDAQEYRNRFNSPERVRIVGN